MNNPELFNRYAIALLELAIEKNETEEFREEVKLIRNIFKEYGEFADLLANVNTELSKKFEIVDKIFKDFKEEIRTFIKIIIRNKRSVYLYQIFKETLFRFDDYLKIEEGKL
jgi:F0F1-type ATP synthase delta subunit